MKTKIADDFELQVTRERLEGAFRALELSKDDTDYSCIESILFTIITLQREIIEYLDYQLNHQSQIASAVHAIADAHPRQMHPSAQMDSNL